MLTHARNLPTALSAALLGLVLAVSLAAGAASGGTTPAAADAVLRSATAAAPAAPAAAPIAARRHVLRAVVRSRRSGPVVRVVVQEVRYGRVVQTRRQAVQVVAGRVHRVRMVLRSPVQRPRFRVRLATPPPRRGDAFSLRRVRWTHPTPATPPTPPPPPVEEPAAGRLTNGCTYSARGIPSCGAYLGMSYGSNTDPTQLEQDYGRRVGVRRTYYTASQVDGAVRTARTDLAAGRLPWISFKLPHAWNAMAAGDGDAWARDLVARLDALGGPVWLAFHHEPEGDGDIAQWKRMQERLGPIVRAADNVGFSVILTGWHQFYGDAQYRLSTMWPSTRVDVAGFDVYNQLGVVKNGQENTRGTDLEAAYFDKIATWARAEGVAWGLAETGISHKGAEQQPGWIQRTYRELDAAGGVALAYFNTPLNSIAPWELTTPEKRAGWRTAQDGSPLMPAGQ